MIGPLTQALAIVTVTTDPRRAEPCIESWLSTATTRWPLVGVEHGVVADTPLTTVQGFAEGVERALRFKPTAEVIACFSDALVLLDEAWDAAVVETFTREPSIGLVSFGGSFAVIPDEGRVSVVGVPLGTTPGLIASPADWCAIGRRSFWSGFTAEEVRTGFSRRKRYPRPWAVCLDAGLAEYGLGEALGCLARRGGWGVWYQPVRHRLVPKPVDAYERWAADQIEGGDRGFSQTSQRILLDIFQDVLPLRLAPGRGDARG